LEALSLEISLVCGDVGALPWLLRPLGQFRHAADRKGVAFLTTEAATFSLVSWLALLLFLRLLAAECGGWH
jgi:hypothetical protein